MALEESASQSWVWTLGGGAGYAPDYEGGDNYEAVPIPLARAQKGHRFGELRGLHITSNLINHPNWRLGPSLNYRQGYGDVSEDAVDNLTNRGSSIELGVKGGYVFDLDEILTQNASLDLSLEVLQDVTDGHEGFLATPSITLATPLSGRWNFVAGVETTYASGSYMSHYFSVNAEDAARSGLENEDADAGMKDAALNLAVGYEISNRWNFNLLGQYKRMLGDAEDSPVVDDVGEEDQFFGGVVISYTWGGGR